MKKQILKACTLAAASLLITSNSFAQWMPVPGAPNAIETDQGLMIDDVRFYQSMPGQGAIRSLRGETDNYFEIYGNHDGDNGPGMFFFNLNTTNPAFQQNGGGVQIWSSENTDGTLGPISNPTDMAFEVINHPNDGNNSYNSLLKVNKYGNIGINAEPASIDPNNPADLQNRLNIGGNIRFADNAQAHRAIRGNSGDYGMVLWANNTWSDGSGILLNGLGGTSLGNMAFSVPSGNGSDAAYTFWGDAFSSHLLTINKNGNIAMGGLPDNTFRLTVDGGIMFRSNTNNWHRHIKGNSPNGGLYLTSHTSWSDGASIIMNSHNNGGHMTFTSTTGNGPTGTAFVFNTNGVSSEAMKITNDGKVRIGANGINMSPNYKLFVETGIMTEKLKVAVKNSANWSDYVFADNYELKSLNEVECYINDNKHLPDVPSAEEVTKDGIDVATMDATLLRKIEELTLYVIQQQKEINELKAKLSK